MELEDLVIYQPIKSAPNFIDRTGYENEYFKVISRAPNKGALAQWNCQCKACGKYCVKNVSNLKKHKSCGCQKNNLIGQALRKDLTNQRFGNLVALEDTGKSNISKNVIWKCQCDCGNICEVDSNNLTSLHTTSCGCIKSSIGEQNIENLLKNNNIQFQKEYSFKDLYFVSKDYPARFDFAIFNNDQLVRLIEYDGIQHYVDTWGKWAEKINLEKQQERDKIKNDYAKQHNIPLVRIPYWERDNITLNMIIGDQYLIH